MGEGVLLAYIFFQGFGTSLGQAYVVAVRPFGRGVPLDADADDLAVLREIKDLLARNHSLLVTLPVERVFKQNYRAFQYSK